MGNETSAVSETRNRPRSWVQSSHKMATSQAAQVDYYRVEMSKTVWEVPARYQELTPIGTGAYGTVWWVDGGRKEQ